MESKNEKIRCLEFNESVSESRDIEADTVIGVERDSVCPHEGTHA